MTHHQLLRWAIDILSRESKSELYGSVTFTYQKGRIVSVRTEKSEKPPLDEYQTE